MDKNIVGVPDLTPEWLRKFLKIDGEIKKQLLRGLECPGKGLSLDHLQALVEHRNPFGTDNFPYLNYREFLAWIDDKGLASKFPGGLQDQLIEQENFYRKFCGNNFVLPYGDIFIAKDRLPAIEAGLQNGVVNYAMAFLNFGLKDSYDGLLAPQKADGLKIWADKPDDRSRWTSCTLNEFFAKLVSVTSSDFNLLDLQNNWVNEFRRVYKKKGEGSAAGIKRSLELVFTSNLQDIPADLPIINSKGEIVEVNDKSFINAMTYNVPILNTEQWVVLQAQMYYRNNIYLARNTWEWRSDILAHPDVNPGFSAANSFSVSSGVNLLSCRADYCFSRNRFRPSL